MRRILNILLVPCLLLAFTACDMFQLDNFDGPNAKFYGSIKDAQTGELVETDIQNGTEIRAIELDWASESTQTWYIKQNGEFRNDLVFAGEYRIEFQNGNIYPFEIKNFNIKKGNNEHHFEVTPYLRIKNPSIRKEGNKIVATFSVEAGKPEVKLRAIRLYAHNDIYVGEQVKFDTKGDGFSQSFSPAKDVDGTTYTLSIDLDNADNQNFFKYDRNFYFRIGAVASMPASYGTIRYNYAPLVVIPL